MAIYSVDVKRTEYGHTFVEADSREEATQRVKDEDFDEDVMPDYYDDGWELDDGWENCVRLVKEDED